MMNSLQVRMLVHQSHAGAIIGKGGSKIKELREKANANIRVFTQCAPASTDRVCQIEGDTDQTMQAIELIHQMLADLPAKVSSRALCYSIALKVFVLQGAIRPYDTMQYDPGYVAEYGGIQGSMRGGGGHGGGGGMPPLPPMRGRGGPPPPMPRGGGRGGYGAIFIHFCSNEKEVYYSGGMDMPPMGGGPEFSAYGAMPGPQQTTQANIFIVFLYY